MAETCSSPSLCTVNSIPMQECDRAPVLLCDNLIKHKLDYEYASYKHSINKYDKIMI